MSRWLILSLLTSGLLLSPLHAQDAPPLKTKASKAAPKVVAPQAKTKAQTKTQTSPGAESREEEALDEKIVRERASYAIGLNFGNHLAQGIKQDGADVDVELLLRGIKDALTNPKPAYTDEEMNAAIEAFDKALEAKTVATSIAVADRNKKAGEAFLAKNKKETGVHTTASGLQYKVIKSGDGNSPQMTDKVRVHYHGMLPDGTAYDSSKQRGEPVEFALSGVIKGWTEALQMMKVGDTWMLYVPSELAYGPQRRSAIGPNQALVFEVELLAIVEGK